eukprot:6188900-Pleurochrysis_carterae.AAC.1
MSPQEKLSQASTLATQQSLFRCWRLYYLESTPAGSAAGDRLTFAVPMRCAARPEMAPCNHCPAAV